MACGMVTQMQSITIGDNIPPTASNPAPINVACAGDVPAPNILVVIDEADNAGTPTVTFVNDVSNNGTCPEIITRTYRVTDNCGNFIDVQQTITIGATVSVVMPANGSAAVNCPGDVIAPVPPVVQDACGRTLTITFDGSSAVPACDGAVVYNYTYTDMNGQTSFIARGLEQAFAKGIFCVVAAGNEGDEVWKYISTPADAKNALTVGSVNASQVYSAFSSIGPTADGRVKPDVMAQGQQVYVVNESGSTITSNGTSFASPIICGLVACLQQALPDTSPAQLMQVIKQSAHLYANPDFYYGYGIPDFSKALNETLSIYSSESDLNQIQLYPNPFTHQIFIENPTQEDFLVKVYNFQGQLILHQTNSSEKFTIDSTGWQQGLYVISIENQTTKIVNKFVRN